MAYEWDQKHSNFTFSNNNRTVTKTDGNSFAANCVISDWSKTSGKWYFEIKADDAGSNSRWGVCKVASGTDYTIDDYPGKDESWGLYFIGSTMRVYHDALLVSTLTDTHSLSEDDIIQIALDLENNKIWWGINNTWLDSGDPAAGTNEHISDATLATEISATAQTYAIGEVFTSQFKNSELTYSPPSGFSAPDQVGETTDGISAEIGLSDSAIIYGEAESPAGLGLGDVTGANVEQTIGITNTFGLDDSSFVFGYPDSPGDGVGINDSIGLNFERRFGVANTIGYSDLSDASREITIGFEETIGLSIVNEQHNHTVWLLQNSDKSVYRFYGTLTGENDGLADYDLPGMRNFQFRSRSGDASYLSIVLPYSAAALSAISARQNGRLIVEMVAIVGGVESLRETLIETDFYSVRYDLGSLNRSISVVGYRTQTYGGQRVTLENIVTETMLADGRMQYRCARPDWYLKPGDTAVNGSDEITVGTINCIIGPTRQYMEVQEADA